MTNNFIFEYLYSSKRLKNLKKFLNELFHIDLFLLDVNGYIVPDYKSYPASSVSLKSAPRKKINRIHNGHPTTKPLVEPDILERTAETQNPESYFCATCSSEKMIIPINCRGNAVGFILAEDFGENRLREAQIQAAMGFIKDTIDSLVKYDLLRVADFSGGKNTHQQKLIQRVVNYIHDNYFKTDISLRSISINNNVSYYYLSRLFKKEQNMSFSNYLNNFRVEAAARMLKDKSLTVGEVSRSCGFVDPGYFCKVFKKTYGSSPDVYRKKNSSSRNRETTLSRSFN